MSVTIASVSTLVGSERVVVFLLLPCPSILLVSVVSVCLHVLRQFHRLHHEWGKVTNVTAINVVPVSEEVCANTTRSGACALIRFNNGELTRF